MTNKKLNLSLLVPDFLEICFVSANHANFFSSYSHPLLSKKVTEWKEQLTVRIFKNSDSLPKYCVISGSREAGAVQAFGTIHSSGTGRSAGVDFDLGNFDQNRFFFQVDLITSGFLEDAGMSLGVAP